MIARTCAQLSPLWLTLALHVGCGGTLESADADRFDDSALPGDGGGEDLGSSGAGHAQGGDEDAGTFDPDENAGSWADPDSGEDASDGGGATAGDNDGGGGSGGSGGDSGGSGGDSGSSGDSGGSGGEPPANLVPAIMAVGYSELRVVSTDHGKAGTWRKGKNVDKTDANTGDPPDDNDQLLRSVAWGNDRWVAVGHKVTISFDGVTWTVPVLFDVGCPLMQGIAFGKGMFVGTCGTAIFRSTDGETWTQSATINYGGKGATTPVIAFGDDKFIATDNSGASYTSSDGTDWKPLEGVSHATFCDGTIKARSSCQGFGTRVESSVWLSTEWPNQIRRTTDGLATNRETVYSNPAGSTAEAFAVGYAAPP